MRKKIVFLGAGSYFFEAVLGELAVTTGLPDLAVVLYDIDAQRLELMYRVCRRIISKAGAGIKLKQTVRLAEALDGADFAISSIGVHGPGQQWHRLDSDVAAEFGIYHTTGDTVGPAGLSQGLRIIPIYVDIARKMDRYCPGAILLNHSNPMAPICRAVHKFSSIRAIGYCHNVYGNRALFAKLLEVERRELDLTVAGVNHCGWLLGIRHHGQDVYPRLREKLLNSDASPFSREVFALFGLYPIGGDRHIIEFFPHVRQGTDPERLPYNLKWRSNQIRAHLPGKELNAAPEEFRLKAMGKKEITLPSPDNLAPEAMGEQLKAMMTGREMLHFVNIPNRGAVPNLPDWAVVEIKAVIGSGGARAVSVGELPAQAARWSLAQIYATN
jgi:alpha-galactosidase